VIEGLFAAGHEIVEIWYGSGSATLKPSKQRRLERQIARKIARLQKGRQFTFRDVGGTSHQDRLALVDTLQNVPGLVSAGSGIIFKQDFLDRFDVAVNFHPAMLPDYRGPHPLQALVLRGDADRFGGMTMHLLAVGIDEGAIVAQQHIPRSSARHSLDWRLKLSAAAGRMARDDL
ncbi:MAG: formyltransferase family protein, partial [Pseudomonadota bacterium]